MANFGRALGRALQAGGETFVSSTELKRKRQLDNLAEEMARSQEERAGRADTRADAAEARAVSREERDISSDARRSEQEIITLKQMKNEFEAQARMAESEGFLTFADLKLMGEANADKALMAKRKVDLASANAGLELVNLQLGQRRALGPSEILQSEARARLLGSQAAGTQQELAEGSTDMAALGRERDRIIQRIDSLPETTSRDPASGDVIRTKVPEVQGIYRDLLGRLNQIEAEQTKLGDIRFGAVNAGVASGDGGGALGEVSPGGVSLAPGTRFGPKQVKEYPFYFLNPRTEVLIGLENEEDALFSEDKLIKLERSAVEPEFVNKEYFIFKRQPLFDYIAGDPAKLQYDLTGEKGDLNQKYLRQSVLHPGRGRTNVEKTKALKKLGERVSVGRASGLLGEF